MGQTSGVTSSECLTDNYTYRSEECSIHHMTKTPTSEALFDLSRADVKLDAAASLLNPIMAGKTTSLAEIGVAVHDALNALAVVKLRLGLAVEFLEEASADE